MEEDELGRVGGLMVVGGLGRVGGLKGVGA